LSMIERFFDRESIIPVSIELSSGFSRSGHKMICSMISIGYVSTKSKGDLIAVNGREPISSKRTKFIKPTISHKYAKSKLWQQG